MIPHDYGNSLPEDTRTTAIVVAHWLIMALPQELADALDRYAASLGPEATAAEAARRILQEVLLTRQPPATSDESPDVR